MIFASTFHNVNYSIFLTTWLLALTKSTTQKILSARKRWWRWKMQAQILSLYRPFIAYRIALSMCVWLNYLKGPCTHPFKPNREFKISFNQGRLKAKMQNSPSKFYHFLFQSFKFEFCQCSPLSFIYSQSSPPLIIC